MDRVAIIPARGGSKRLPRKNILPLGNKPLLMWVIENCKKTNIFERIIVSTEDEEIADVAHSAGAEVFERTIALSHDTATVVQVCEEVLSDIPCDIFCCIYATSVFLSPSTLIKSANIFDESTDANVLMGVSQYNYAPVQALKVDDSGFASLLFPEYANVQSQKYPVSRVSNGTFYWGRRTEFLKEMTFYSDKLKVFDVPDNEVCDIDTEQDYKEAMLRFEKKNRFPS
ncbi:acylneuraminate cytidylyltransferase family protein [Billgrantia sp. Q4P2]|uniref:acylneuraminate cytidylyltransferase family protein n=1 Tax=Billgrantia sp. Q4P2 TaxID=3463857 RepID=UPI0040576777